MTTDLKLPLRRIKIFTPKDINVRKSDSMSNGLYGQRRKVNSFFLKVIPASLGLRAGRSGEILTHDGRKLDPDPSSDPAVELFVVSGAICLSGVAGLVGELSERVSVNSSVGLVTSLVDDCGGVVPGSLCISSSATVELVPGSDTDAAVLLNTIPGSTWSSEGERAVS